MKSPSLQDLEKLELAARLVKRYLNRNSEGLQFLIKGIEGKVAPRGRYSLEQVEEHAVSLLKEQISYILEFHTETSLKIVERYDLFLDNEILNSLKERLLQTSKLIEENLTQPVLESWMTDFESDRELNTFSIIKKNPKSTARLKMALDRMFSEICAEELDKIDLILLTLKNEDCRTEKEDDRIVVTAFTGLKSFEVQAGKVIRLSPNLFKICIILIGCNEEKMHVDQIAEELGNPDAAIQKYISEINIKLFGKSRENHLFEPCGESSYRLKPKYKVIIK